MNLTREEVKQKYLRVSGIYCWTNIYNNKKYIGQSVNLYERYLAHLSGRNGAPKFRNSIKKYGGIKNILINFEFSVLEIIVPEELNNREKYWIKELKTTENDFGYNILVCSVKMYGGDYTESVKEKQRATWKIKIENGYQSPPFSEEARKKGAAASRARKGIPKSEETRKKMSIAKKVMPISAKVAEIFKKYRDSLKNGNYPESVKEKQRATWKIKIENGYVFKQKSIPVVAVFEKDSIDYPSIKAAVRAVEGSETGLCAAIEKKTLYKGYYWRYGSSVEFLKQK